MALFRKVLLHVCLFLYVSFITPSLTYDTFKTTLKILQHQSGRKYDSIIIVFDFYEEKQQTDLLRETIYHQMFDKDHGFMGSIVSHKNNSSSLVQNIEDLLRAPMYSLLVVLDFKIADLIRQAVFRSSRAFVQDNTWLFVNPYDDKNASDINNFKQSLEYWHNENIKLDSQLYVLNGNLTYASLLEVYKVCKDGELTITEVQNITDVTELQDQTTMIWDRRNDLMGCTLRIAYVDSFPYITKAKEDDVLTNINRRYILKSGNTTMYGGMVNQLEIMTLLVSDLNFTISWIRAEDNSYGVYNTDTKSWNGLIGLMTTDKADLSNAYLTVTKSRSTAISFTTEIDQTNFGLFMAKPGISPSWSTFVDVFNLKYWCVLFTVAILLSLTLVLFFYILENNETHIANNFIRDMLSSTSVMLLSLATYDVFIEMKFHSKVKLQIHIVTHQLLTFQ